MKTMSVDEWNAEGLRLFGKRARNWQFICPACGTVQTGGELLALCLSAEAAVRYMGVSCIGRFPGATKGCDWTLYGLFHIHELEVIDADGEKHFRFEFATPETIAKYAAKRARPSGKVIGTVESPIVEALS